jgi:response regulator RpfG family c-di-GMP phosphodiesterase
MSGSRLKVIIIDDEYAIRLIIRAYLAPYAVDVIDAKNGEEAFEIMERIVPELVIVDYNMPVMTGREVISRMCEDEKLRNVPIVMYTASNFDDSTLQSMKSMTTAFIQKTRLGDDLVPTLKSMFGDLLEKGNQEDASEDVRVVSPGSCGESCQQDIPSGQKNDEDEIVETEEAAEADLPKNEQEESEIKALLLFKSISEKLFVKSYFKRYGISCKEAMNMLEYQLLEDENAPDLVLAESHALDENSVTLIDSLGKENNMHLVLVLSKGQKPEDIYEELNKRATAFIKMPLTEKKLSGIMKSIVGAEKWEMLAKN